MSRLTSAQVISLGEYLEPDFNPSSLTVSQLLGVLGYHNINYPTPYSKPKLVQLFNDEIKSKTTKLKKDRIKKANSIASDDGITDGLTGKPLGKPPVMRRSSRRLSKIPAANTDDEHDISPVRSEAVKRRRSSAQPALEGTASRYKAPIEVTAILESGSESEVLPVKKVGRTRKTVDSAATQSHRASFGEDSGWEDNNIFQSGAEDSSPARPLPSRAKLSRKSAGARKSRKSLSAPPQVSPPSSPTRIPTSNVSPPFSPQATEFKPDPPFVPIRDFRLPPRSPVIEPVREECQEDAEPLNQEEVQSAQITTPIQNEVTSAEPGVEENTQVDGQAENISERVARSMRAVKTRPLPPAHKSSWLARLVTVVLTLISAYQLYDYKIQSAAIGYCDTGSKTSPVVEDIKARHLAVRECNRENRTALYPTSSDTSAEPHDLTPCPLPPLIPLPQPESCTPCPEHASCSRFRAICDTGYLLHPNSLLFFLPTPPPFSNITLASASSLSEYVWGILSDCLNGLPGFGSIAFPPRCLEDPNRKRHIGALGKAIEATLGKERGRRLCSGGKVAQNVKDSDGGEAREWGVEISKLKETMRRKTSVNLLPAFDDTFNEAIQQLVQWGGIVIGEDTEGHRYLAHRTPELTWDCVLIVKTREAWTEWKPKVLALVATVLATLLARMYYIRRKIETRRVGELVQIALDTLRNQELAYYTDPVTAPQPYLSSLQLRDLILQDEHSVPIRRRLWDQVERVVESNANVRANMEEVEGGDELRVWRWIGSSRGKKVESTESNAPSPLGSPSTTGDRS